MTSSETEKQEWVRIFQSQSLEGSLSKRSQTISAFGAPPTRPPPRPPGATQITIPQTLQDTLQIPDPTNETKEPNNELKSNWIPGKRSNTITSTRSGFSTKRSLTFNNSPFLKKLEDNEC